MDLLLKELNKISAEVTEAQTTSQQWQDYNTRLQQEKSALELESGQIASELRDQKAKLDQVAKESERITHQISLACKQRDDLLQQVSHAQSELATFEERTAFASNSLRAVQDELKLLTARSQDLKKHAAEEETEFERLLQEKSAIEAQLAQMERDYEKANAELEKTRDMAQSQSRIVESLEARQIQLQTTCKFIEDEIQAKKCCSAELDAALTEQNVELAHVLEMVTERRNHFEQISAAIEEGILKRRSYMRM